VCLTSPYTHTLLACCLGFIQSRCISDFLLQQSFHYRNKGEGYMLLDKLNKIVKERTLTHILEKRILLLYI
jgi:hypothetical protein